MTPARRSMPPALIRARQKADLLSAVDWAAAHAWPVTLGAKRAAEVFAPTSRLARRGYAALGLSLDEFMLNAGAAGAVALMPVPDLTVIAHAAGLAYHLPAFHGVIAKADIELLGVHLGQDAVSLALEQALSGFPMAQEGVADKDSPDFPDMVRADGWALLRLWGDHHALPRTLLSRWPRHDAGSVSLHLGRGLAIVEALVVQNARGRS
ncbi:hypothetical protein ACQ3G6_09655 [Allorhizobium undicola]|uniref:hypothetical protein n=1 Tax=Allorhizobium undicola TaxID=78527 RepID=UPI003D32AAA0